MAYEDFAHKSLDDILKTDSLTWASRLEICIRVAIVLNYLHSGVEELRKVIHGDVKCENILLNTRNLERIKVCGFKHSKLVPLNQPHQHHSCPEELFKKSHTDPIYKETSLLNTESDIYSFGVLMFVILHGIWPDENHHQLMNLVRGCYNDGPYKLVDPSLNGDRSYRSVQIFTTLAYKCINFDIKERPRMDEIFKTIEKALDIHNDSRAIMNPQTKKKFKIPLEEIRKAIGAEDFDRRVSYTPPRIMIHRGKLADRCNDREAFFKHLPYMGTEIFRMRNELLLISSFHHENITPFIGHCVNNDEIIIASEYALNGSLYLKLETQHKNSYLKWAERLKICLGAARGLKYIHAGFGVHKVIHGDFKSRNILLYDNLEAKICGFGKSFLIPKSHPDTNVYKEARGSKYYMDPVYRESLIPRVESDVYSFGVVLFEVLTGRLACNYPIEQISKIDKLIDNLIRDEIDARSLRMFKDIAYKCISFNMKDRPSMNQVVKRLEEALYIQTHGAASTVARKNQKLKDFRIPLEDINVKGQKIIGKGGFGVVYVGQLSERWQNRTVAIKYLYPKSDHEEHVFRNELNMIFSFSHENIIPFIGYCDEGNKKIIVYEHASNGSLDCHLEREDKRRCLTWESRLKICLGAARGLEYLHSGRGEDENSVIHRDVKSGNILLDHNLVAKICDFGLSKAGPINKLQTQVYTNIAGTNFYMDPVYHESGVLRKVSDVYSFGVVMFELLSGLPVYYRRSIGDNQEKLLLLHLVRRYYDHKPELLIDPLIKYEIDDRSFDTFKEVAFQCISFNSKERPTMETIVDRVEEALELQTHGAASTIARQIQKLEDFRIPLEDINLATRVKGKETRIGNGGFGFVYKGQLSERWQNRTVAIKCLRPDSYQGEHEFRNELNMIFRFSHKNIIPFIGYCDEGKEKIIVYDYASNGSLDRHLEDKEKRRFLTWEHRLKICLGAAKGLDYLHSGLGEENRVIHRDVKSGNILLDHNFVAKVCDFGLSKSGPINQQHTQLYTNAAGSKYYMDPLYHESGVLRKESDVYSFGVVMFELLSGMLAYHQRKLEGGKPIPLINIVRRYYHYKPDLIIDPLIRDEIDIRSFNAYREVAFQCVSINSKERPTMEMIMDRVEEALELQTHGAARQIQELEDFRIPLEEINLAIGVKGQETLIGNGGFGFVYKGQLSERWQNRTVAIQRLRPDSYQREYEFRNELNTIYRFSHKNIIRFIGYCDEGKEKIKVYDYASNGSLDRHLEDKEKRSFLTWEHRLKICLGAAKGLDYLHSGLGEENGVIHRDVKSRNILLDHNFVAKVCDFGLSKSGPINQQDTQVYTNAAGTNFYMDPVYHEGGVLRKESDVYSFGVVMFELLSGMLAYHKPTLESGKPKPLVNIVRRYYHYKPDLIIDPLIRDEIDIRSFNAYREVAFQCIRINSKDRPTMEMIVDWVEEALELQVTNQGDLKQKVTGS